MGYSIDEIVSNCDEGYFVKATIASNQDDGVVSYATGGFVYHPFSLKTGQHARLLSDGPFTMLFSDRTRDTAIGGGELSFPNVERQPFDLHEAEQDVGVLVSIGPGEHRIRLSVFGGQSTFTVRPMGNLLVGQGPSVSPSGRPAVFVLALTGYGPRPTPPR